MFKGCLSLLPMNTYGQTLTPAPPKKKKNKNTLIFLCWPLWCWLRNHALAAQLSLRFCFRAFARSVGCTRLSCSVTLEKKKEPFLTFFGEDHVWWDSHKKKKNKKGATEEVSKLEVWSRIQNLRSSSLVRPKVSILGKRKPCARVASPAEKDLLPLVHHQGLEAQAEHGDGAEPHQARRHGTEVPRSPRIHPALLGLVRWVSLCYFVFFLFGVR